MTPAVASERSIFSKITIIIAISRVFHDAVNIRTYISGSR